MATFQMSGHPFSCRNTIQRLREQFEVKRRGKEQLMGNVHVAYTITVKAENGKELSFDKERTLYEQDTVNPETLQDVLKRNFRETEQPQFLTAVHHQLGNAIADITFRVTKITELKSAGDDDQM